MIRIQTEDFSVETEVTCLRRGNPRIGGIVSFLGTVRDFTEPHAGAGITALILEHYPGMTEAELEKIEQAARARFAVEEILVVHRVGLLQVEENIVLVVAAAAHRADAFAACRYVIDHLKVHATFWKKEVTTTGEQRWVDACSGCEAAASQWQDLQDVVQTHHVSQQVLAESDSRQAPAAHPPELTVVPHQPVLDQHYLIHAAQHQRAVVQQVLARDHAVLWGGLQVGIVTLSDSRTLASDRSGDALEGLVLGFGGHVVVREILPDEQHKLQALLIQWADDQKLDVILTTGGTGPSPRDVTPEATRAVCNRELPGVAELIRVAGLQQTRHAVLTRGVTALRGVTLVINLPGSTRGAVHSLEAIADLVPHILRMARGGGHEAS